MKTYFDRACVLTETVRNPSYDKRKKYGSEAIAEIEKGTVVFIFEGNGELGPSVYDRRGNYIAMSGMTKFIGVILAHIEPYAPTEWKDRLVFAFGGNLPLQEVVDKLVESGVVTADQILEAAASVDAQAEAGQ